jgi:transcriptional regulator with XRE-family HTH domain
MDDAPANLARNVRQLREGRGMTQQQLAERSGVPRATLTNVESGSANPTLSVLLKVARALTVSLEELVSPPRASARLYRAAALPVRKRGVVRIRRVLPDPLGGLEIERLDLPVGAQMAGVPHLAGTREYLTCESGALELVASGERYELAAGDVVVFRGDQPHGYRNVGDVPAVGYSVIVLAPVSEVSGGSGPGG